MHALVARSHTRTVLSSLPEASSSRPSAAVPNATEFTHLAVAGERPAMRGPGNRIPDPYRLVPAAGGEQQPPVGGGAERHRLDAALVWPVSGPPTAPAPVTIGSQNRTVASHAGGGEQQPPRPR